MRAAVALAAGEEIEVETNSPDDRTFAVYPLASRITTALAVTTPGEPA